MTDGCNKFVLGSIGTFGRNAQILCARQRILHPHLQGLAVGLIAHDLDETPIFPVSLRAALHPAGPKPAAVLA